MNEAFFILVDDGYGPRVYGPYLNEEKRKEQLELLLEEEPLEPTDNIFYLDQGGLTGGIQAYRPNL